VEGFVKEEEASGRNRRHDQLTSAPLPTSFAPIQLNGHFYHALLNSRCAS